MLIHPCFGKDGLHRTLQSLARDQPAPCPQSLVPDQTCVLQLSPNSIHSVSLLYWSILSYRLEWTLLLLLLLRIKRMESVRQKQANAEVTRGIPNVLIQMRALLARRCTLSLSLSVSLSLSLSLSFRWIMHPCQIYRVGSFCQNEFWFVCTGKKRGIVRGINLKMCWVKKRSSLKARRGKEELLFGNILSQMITCARFYSFDTFSPYLLEHFLMLPFAEVCHRDRVAK